MFNDGEIEHVLCETCGESFPVYIFVADNDMVTNGWFSFTGTKCKDIILAQLSVAEEKMDLSKVIGPDYKHVNVSFQEQAPVQISNSFQDFLKTYKPAIAIYVCIYCGGRALKTYTESQQGFISHNKISIRNGT